MAVERVYMSLSAKDAATLLTFPICRASWKLKWQVIGVLDKSLFLRNKWFLWPYTRKYGLIRIFPQVSLMEASWSGGSTVSPLIPNLPLAWCLWQCSLDSSQLERTHPEIEKSREF